MERFRDRVSANPNRRKIRIIKEGVPTGEEFFADIERTYGEDVQIDPITNKPLTGTPITAETLNANFDELNAIKQDKWVSLRNSRTTIPRYSDNPSSGLQITLPNLSDFQYIAFECGRGITGKMRLHFLESRITNHQVFSFDFNNLSQEGLHRANKYSFVVQITSDNSIEFFSPLYISFLGFGDHHNRPNYIRGARTHDGEIGIGKIWGIKA